MIKFFKLTSIVINFNFFLEPFSYSTIIQLLNYAIETIGDKSQIKYGVHEANSARKVKITLESTYQLENSAKKTR